jgi:hypothetical protein
MYVVFIPELFRLSSGGGGGGGGCGELYLAHGMTLQYNIYR